MLTTTKREIYSIPGKMVGHHHPEIDTIIDTWTSSLFVSLKDWKSTVYDVGITDYAPKHGVTNWIIDTSAARSVFPPEVQEFRQNVAKEVLERNGVKRLIVVIPAKGIGKFSAAKTAELYDSDQGNGLHGYEVTSLQEALDLIRKGA